MTTLALGDSIALGLGAALHVATIARVGASSCAILAYTPRAHFDRVIISAGVNDPPGRCIGAIRARLDAREIVWILPVNFAAANVLRVAAAHGDRVVAYAPGRDRVHPQSYAALAASVGK